MGRKNPVDRDRSRPVSCGFCGEGGVYHSRTEALGAASGASVAWVQIADQERARSGDAARDREGLRKKATAEAAAAEGTLGGDRAAPARAKGGEGQGTPARCLHGRVQVLGACGA